ncbi:Adaptin ear-binding coat-associated protein 1, partial [Stegodyphus mimosarum]
MDSSRYFVLRIEDDDGRAAFIGIGFADRADSFDLNVALQEHFKWLQKSEEIQQELDTSESKTNLNLGFKEGETITINMNIGKKSGSSTKPRPKPSTFSGTPGLLPPPPGGVKLPAPPTSRPVNQSEAPHSTPLSQSNSAVNSQSSSAADLLLDLGLSAETGESKPASANSSGAELWGDFTTATGETSAVQQKDTTAGN